MKARITLGGLGLLCLLALLAFPVAQLRYVMITFVSLYALPIGLQYNEAMLLLPGCALLLAVLGVAGPRAARIGGVLATLLFAVVGALMRRIMIGGEMQWLLDQAAALLARLIDTSGQTDGQVISTLVQNTLQMGMGYWLGLALCALYTVAAFTMRSGPENAQARGEAATAGSDPFATL